MKEDVREAVVHLRMRANAAHFAPGDTVAILFLCDEVTKGEEEPGEHPDEHLVDLARKELWPPGHAPTPESVAAFMRRHADITSTSFLDNLNGNELEFLMHVVSELSRAKVKYPAPDGRFTALVSEVGELATALLREPKERVWPEAVQVAVVALRVAVEGDPSLEGRRA